MDGWMEGRKDGKAGLRIAYSNQKCLDIKLMRLASPNRIDVVESNLESEFARQISSIR